MANDTSPPSGRAPMPFRWPDQFDIAYVILTTVALWLLLGELAPSMREAWIAGWFGGVMASATGASVLRYPVRAWLVIAPFSIAAMIVIKIVTNGF